MYFQILFQVRMNITYLLKRCIYGTNTTEVHRPSSSKRSKKQKTLPFVASIQHIKNVNLMVQCEECGMWRIVYSKKKLSVQLKKNSRESSTTSISAVVQVHQIWTYPKNSLMFISEIFEVKILLRSYIYYSMGYEPICIYCSLEEDLVISEKYYPICASCLLFIYRKFNFSCIICVRHDCMYL